MVDAELTVRNPSGLHARPAALFAEAAGEFASQITVRNLTADSHAVDAKSVLMVLTLGVQPGHRIGLEAEGTDAEAAVARLTELVEAGLGETLTD